MTGPTSDNMPPATAEPPALEGWVRSRAGRIVAGILLIGTLLWLGTTMREAVLDAEGPRGNDYGIFAEAGRRLLKGEDIIGLQIGTRDRTYLCHPWFAVVMAPFGLMSTGAASFAWPLFNLALLVASSWLCLRIVRGPDAPLPWPLLVMPLFLTARALDSNFSLGQVNVIILSACCLGIWLYLKGRPFLGGLALSVATLIKLHPGLICAYFLWKRQWRAAAGAMAGGLFLLFVVPMFFYGPAGGFSATFHWLDTSIRQSASGIGEHGYVAGQSLRPIAHRFLTDSVAYSHGDAEIRVNVASLSAGAAEAVYKAAAVVLLAAVVALTWGRGDPTDRRRMAAELSLVCIAMLMAAPFTRKAHFVLLMLPMTYTYSTLALGGLRTGRRKALLGAGVVCYVLTVLTTPALMGDALSDLLTALTCMGWGALILFGGLAAYRPPAASTEEMPARAG